MDITPTIFNSNRNTNYQTKTQYNANLFLQILLFLNVYIAPVWIVTMLFVLYDQFHLMLKIEKILLIFSLVILMPIECIRLYLGYSGNLRGRIPDFIGFWILSMLIQFPGHIYILFTEFILINTINLIIEIIIVLLLSLEICKSLFVIKHYQQLQLKQLHLQNLIKLSHCNNK